MKIILASASPRRKELLEKICKDFIIKVSDCDESMDDTSLLPADNAKMLAERKALAVYEQNREYMVIGSDTIVECQNEILGKPISDIDAISMLSKLSGKSHNVHTGVCIITPKEKISFVNSTKVYFKNLTKNEILNYIQTGEHKDKAGAYGIQGAACAFIRGIEGDYFSVMGLPVNMIYEKLEELGYRGLLKM